MSDNITLGWQDVAERWEQAYLDEKARADAAEAKVDALMLEYCPDDMTDEQWNKVYQTPFEIEEQTHE